MSVWRQLRGTFYSTQNSGFRLFSVKEDNLLRYNQIFENLFPGTFRSIWFSCWNFRIFRSNGSGFRKFDNFQIFWNLSLEISAPLVPVLKISGFLFDGGDGLGFNGKCSGFSGHFPRKGTWAHFQIFRIFSWGQQGRLLSAHARESKKVFSILFRFAQPNRKHFYYK